MKSIKMVALSFIFFTSLDAMESSRSKKVEFKDNNKLSLLKQTLTSSGKSRRIAADFNQDDFKECEQFILHEWTSLKDNLGDTVHTERANKLHDSIITMPRMTQKLLQDQINYIEERIWKHTSGDRYTEYKKNTELHNAIYQIILASSPVPSTPRSTDNNNL